MKKIHDRTKGGKLLAKKLMQYANNPAVLVLALPRGGVPVAYQISQALHAELDLFLVRKLGAPYQEELAMGAIALGGIKVLNDEIIKHLNISTEELNAVIAKEQNELTRRNGHYRNNRPLPEIKDKIIIMVDDGIATGATMRVACEAIKKLNPAKIIIAVPVAPIESLQELQDVADDIVCLFTPAPFYSLSLWYDKFSQTSDAEVCSLLQKST